MSKKKIRTEYDKAFKFEAVKLSEKSNQNVEEVAKDLGIAVSNLHRWRREYRNASTQAFPGKGHQAEEDEEVRRLRQEVATLKQERDILKKATVYLAKRKPVKYVWIAKNTSHFSLVYMCQITGVCKSGFYCGQK